MGLTDAEGWEIEFYQYKNGARGAKIGDTLKTDNRIPVNTALQVVFPWTVPADGPEGYSIQAVVREKNGEGYYNPVETFSETFRSAPAYNLRISEAVQDGDKFRVTYTAENAGNADAEAGTRLGIRLVGLHGDLASDRYGKIENPEVYSKDITSALKKKTAETKTATQTAYTPREVSGEVTYEASTWDWPVSQVTNGSFAETATVKLPASLFRYCGYDAIQLVLLNKDGIVVAESSQKLVTMDEPMNLSLNEGKTVAVSSGGAQQVNLDYDSTVFMDAGTVVYSVADPSVAYVDTEGELMGLTTGSTTLTATLLPYGRSVSVPVSVDGAQPEAPISVTYWANGGTGSAEAQTLTKGTAVTLSANPFSRSGYRFTGWNTAADGSGTAYTEGQTVTPDTDLALYAQWQSTGGGSGSGGSSGGGGTASPKPTPTPAPEDTAPAPLSPEEIDALLTPFTDLDKDAWYRDGVAWALHEGVMNGTGGSSFAPNTAASRAMIVTMLYRMAGEPAAEGGASFEDVPAGQWYTNAVRWAAENGIVNGYGDGRFGPNDVLTREQLAAILCRYAQLEGLDTGTGAGETLSAFHDAAAVSAWAIQPIGWAVSEGIIQGTGNDTISPSTDANRAQIATMLMRYAALDR